jgi:hypothetical protein
MSIDIIRTMLTSIMLSSLLLINQIDGRTFHTRVSVNEHSIELSTFADLLRDVSYSRIFLFSSSKQTV